MKLGYMKRSLSDEWGTPLGLFVGMCKTFQVYPEIDVCANERNRKCENFFSKEQDGLIQEWNKDFWLSACRWILGNNVVVGFVHEGNNST